MTSTDELDFLQPQKPKRTETSPRFFTPATIVLMIGILAVIVVLGLQLYQQNQGQPVPGSKAPNFTLTSYKGEVYELKDLRGQIVVLNIWANWCPPCHAEAPDFQDIWEDYQDQGVLLLGANYLEIDSVAAEFIERYNITYPNGSDTHQQIAEAYNFEAPPETFVIDQEGKIAAVFIGGITYDRLAATLDQLLEEGA